MMSLQAMSSENIQPIALIFYPKTVDEAFNLNAPDTVRRIQHLKQGYQVYTFNVNSIGEAYEKAQETLKSGKCAYMEFAGHGNQREFVFDRSVEGGVFSLDSDKKITELFANLLQLVEHDGVIATQSCENGAMKKKGGNILQRIGELAPSRQRIFGTSAKRTHIGLLGTRRHLRLTEDGTGENVTCIYQNSFCGNPQRISFRQVEVLWHILGDSQGALELSYKILAEVNHPDELKLWFNQLRDLPGKIIKYFEGLTIEKDSNTVWGEMLNDLEALSDQLQWSDSKAIVLAPEDRIMKITESNGVIHGPDHRKEPLYSSVYKFILALSAMEEYSDLVVILDNKKPYMENPAAQALYALTNHTLHSHQIRTRQLLHGDISALVVAKRSYELAKKQGRLLDWFKNAFTGVCLDERCESLQTYLEMSQFCEEKELFSFDLIISDKDTTEQIIFRCAEEWMQYNIKQLGLEETPKTLDDKGYFEYQLTMTQNRFYEYVEHVFVASGIKTEGKSEAINQAINALGTFSSAEEIDDLIKEIAVKGANEVIRLKEWIPKNKQDLAGLLMEVIPDKVPRMVKDLGFTIDEAVQFCIDNQIQSIDLRPFEERVNDHNIDFLTKNNPDISHIYIKSTKITNAAIQMIVERCPNLLTLCCSRCDGITELSELPDTVITLDCSWCFGLKKLLKLPESLKVFDCKFCILLTGLPKLPLSLKVLNCRDCRDLVELPVLPDSLVALICSDCCNLKKPLSLPDSLIKLDCTRCSFSTEC